MLSMWREIDAYYWGAGLQPCWLTCSIEAYGKALGSWNESTRTLNLVPQLFRKESGLSVQEFEDAMQCVRSVLVHESCHQAACQLFDHLNGAKGPRGKWTDLSHRCPAWSRACWEVLQKEGLPYFVPVWHRSSGNTWSPWVPASDDWMTWRKVDPMETFNGCDLMDMKDSREFMIHSSLDAVVASIGLPVETASGEPIDWII